MKRILTTALLLFSTLTYGQSEPITSLQGQGQTSKFTSPKLVVPYNQATNTPMGGLIETDNGNILTNGGFEHKTFNTGWTSATGTSTLTTEALVAGSTYSGKQALKIVSIGAGVRLYQSVTTNAASFKGGQMTARVAINSTDPLLQVCANKDSVSAGTDEGCQFVPVTTTAVPWQIIEVPFIAGSTSNVIVIKSATTTTQNIYVDNASLFQGLPRVAKIVGDVTFTAQVSSTGVISQVTPSGWLSGNCVVTLGAFACPALAGKFSLQPNCQVTATTTTGTAALPSFDTVNSTASSIILRTVNSTTGVASPFPFSLSCTKQTTDYNNSSSSAYITNTVKPVIVAKVSNFTTVANTDYLMPFNAITSNTGGYALNANGVTMQQAGKYIVRLKGQYGANNEAITQKVVVSGTSAYTVTGQQQQIDINGGGSFSVLTDTFIMDLKIGDILKMYVLETSTGRAGYAAEMSIEYADSNAYSSLSFANMETCANAYECENRFSAQMGTTGTITNENIDWINGNCTVSTGTVTCTLNTNLKDGVNPLTSPMNCGGNSISAGGSGFIVTVQQISNTQIRFITTNGGTPTSLDMSLWCDKGPNDFKPKTAKIASSIGVPTVPGIVGTSTGDRVDTFTVKYGTGNASTVCSASPCFISQIGNAVTSITRTLVGVYSLNLARNYISLICTQVATGTSSYLGGQMNAFTSGTNVQTFQSGINTTSTDSFGSLMCQGTY